MGELTAEKLEELEAILMDSARAQAVIDASKSSMGMDISPVDLLNIDMFASRVIGITEYRKELSTYLRSKMSVVAPNLATLIGESVGARLIAHAGSLTNLAKAPASSVQILGAEKALFRALKTRGNTPKYGLIFHSSFIGRAGAKNKGRISRYLANKCSIASRIDAFSEDTTTVFGSKLKEQVEERLKFYETGDLPRKNVDVMAEAVEEAAEATKKKKKKDKTKKRKAEEADETMDTTGPAVADTTVEDETAEPPKKKKKKRELDTTPAPAPEPEPEPEQTVVEAAGDESAKKKKKKKKKNKEEAWEEEHKGNVSLEEVVPEVNGIEKKKKKKKNKAEA